MIRFLRMLAPLWVAGLCLAQSATMRQGRNILMIRGVPQDVYYFPGSGNGATAAGRPCVIYLPGDGGWRGFAITIAERVAGWGYDIYGVDTKRYLESFTGKTTLKESEVQADIRSFADAVRRERRVTLLGWSAGAGLVALAAAAPAKEAYAGLVAISLSDSNVLGWKFADNLTYVTGKQPDEPTFSALSYMPRITPLPLILLQSSRDEYIGAEETNRLIHAAAEPKRIVVVPAQNHRFDGAQPEFFQRLKEGLEWIAAGGPKP